MRLGLHEPPWIDLLASAEVVCSCAWWTAGLRWWDGDRCCLDLQSDPLWRVGQSHLWVCYVPGSSTYVLSTALEMRWFHTNPPFWSFDCSRLLFSVLILIWPVFLMWSNSLGHAGRAQWLNKPQCPELSRRRKWKHPRRLDSNIILCDTKSGSQIDAAGQGGRPSLQVSDNLDHFLLIDNPWHFIKCKIINTFTST